MYYILLNEENRILSASYSETEESVQVETLPEGDICDYLYIDGEYIYSPLPEPEPALPQPTQLDRIEAQITYTAMMTNTLLED